MKFNIQALALSAGITGVAILGLCILWMYSFPNMMGAGMFGGMMGFGSAGMMGGSIFVGAIIAFVIAWVAGWLLGTLYNKFSK